MHVSEHARPVAVAGVSRRDSSQSSRSTRPSGWSAAGEITSNRLLPRCSSDLRSRTDELCLSITPSRLAPGFTVAPLVSSERIATQAPVSLRGSGIWGGEHRRAEIFIRVFIRRLSAHFHRKCLRSSDRDLHFLSKFLWRTKVENVKKS